MTPIGHTSKSKAPRKGGWAKQALKDLKAAQGRVYAENQRQGFAIHPWKNQKPKPSASVSTATNAS